MKKHKSLVFDHKYRKSKEKFKIYSYYFFGNLFTIQKLSLLLFYVVLLVIDFSSFEVKVFKVFR